MWEQSFDRIESVVVENFSSQNFEVMRGRVFLNFVNIVRLSKLSRGGGARLRISGHKVIRLQGMPGRDTLFVHYRFRI